MVENCYYVWDVVLTTVSIIATFSLSAVAIWQNNRYKKLANRKDEIRQSEIKEENRLKIRPYLFSSYEEKSFDKLIEESVKEFIFIDNISEDKKAYDTHYAVPYEVFDITNEKDRTTKAWKMLGQINRYLLVSYTIINVGAGTAIDIILKINGKMTLPPFAIMVGEKREINLLFDFDGIGKCNDEEFILAFQYHDMENNQKYVQETTFKIYEKDSLEDRKDHYTSSFCKITAPTAIVLKKDEK